MFGFQHSKLFTLNTLLSTISPGPLFKYWKCKNVIFLYIHYSDFWGQFFVFFVTKSNQPTQTNMASLLVLYIFINYDFQAK